MTVNTHFDLGSVLCCFSLIDGSIRTIKYVEFVKVNFEDAKVTKFKIKCRDCQSNLDTFKIERYFIYSQLGNARITFLVQIIL